MNLQTRIAPVEEVIAVLHRILPAHVGELRPETNLLSGSIDLDSLQLLEVVEGLRSAYGVDFLAGGAAFQELHSPITIAHAIQRAKCVSPLAGQHEP